MIPTRRCILTLWPYYVVWTGPRGRRRPVTVGRIVQVQRKRQQAGGADVVHLWRHTPFRRWTHQHRGRYRVFLLQFVA